MRGDILFELSAFNTTVDNYVVYFIIVVGFFCQCCLFNDFFALEKAEAVNKLHTGVSYPQLSAGCSGTGLVHTFLSVDFFVL